MFEREDSRARRRGFCSPVVAAAVVAAAEAAPVSPAEVLTVTEAVPAARLVSPLEMEECVTLERGKEEGKFSLLSSFRALGLLGSRAFLNFKRCSPVGRSRSGESGGGRDWRRNQRKEGQRDRPRRFSERDAQGDSPVYPMV